MPVYIPGIVDIGYQSYSDLEAVNMMSVLAQQKISFLIDDLLRDNHEENKMPADTPAVITTGFPRYCFPPKNLSRCESALGSPRG